MRFRGVSGGELFVINSCYLNEFLDLNSLGLGLGFYVDLGLRK